MIELAKREGSGPAAIVDVAHAQHIPARFLEAILRELKQAGLTKSVRGKKGGYVLAKPAKDIAIGEVIRLLDGPIFVTDTARRAARGVGTPDVLQTTWREAEQALNHVFEKATFADLAERDRQAAQTYIADYSI